MKFVLLAVSLCWLGFSVPALAKPATTLSIPDTTTWSPPEKHDWFVRGDLSTDVPFQGATGGGIGVGHLERFLFFDLSLMYFHANYGAVSVYQPNGTTPGTASQIGLNRAANESESILTVGPGVGSVFKFFESERWIEMARFGLNYTSLTDSTRGLSLRGGLANFNASFGYTFSSVVLAPGVTWNLGYLQNTAASASTTSSHQAFLPVQWFSWQLALYFWL